MARRANMISALAAVLTVALPLHGQSPTAMPTAAWEAPAVGSMAPDFQLPGASRYGLLKTSIRLSDFRDKTVVIAFFAQARTKG